MGDQTGLSAFVLAVFFSAAFASWAGPIVPIFSFVCRIAIFKWVTKEDSQYFRTPLLFLGILEATIYSLALASNWKPRTLFGDVILGISALTTLLAPPIFCCAAARSVSRKRSASRPRLATSWAMASLIGLIVSYLSILGRDFLGARFSWFG